MMPQEVTLEVYPSLGMQTALNPAELPQGAQRRAYDAIMKSINTIGKRPGSIPVTEDALTDPIAYLTVYRTTTDELLAVSADTLYKLDSGALTGVTMTDTFDSPNVFSVAFTDAASVSVLFLTDGGNVKQYDGTAVKDVVPAANDPNPAPPNDLANVNALGVKYCWVHTGHIFLTDGSDTVWYTKRFTYDYVPSVQFERWVRNNDIITGPGITYNNVCLIPMRRGWGILTGELFDDGTVPNGFSGNQFLNTTAGNISSRGMARITYPDGSESVAYLSDDGVHEIFTVTALSTGDRQYSTRSLTRDKLDFEAFGFTESEKQAAVMWFDTTNSRMILAIKRDTANYVLAYDTRNREWYQWRFPWSIQAMVKHNSINYYGGSTGHIHAFDEELYSDWDDKDKTTGTPVDFDVYSPLISFEFSGDNSYLHYYLVESQQFTVPASLDVYIIYGAGTVNLSGVIQNEILVWNFGSWNQGQWANLDFTDVVNLAKRMVIHRRAKYFQRRWRNDRNEPVLVLKEKYVGTISGRL